MKYLHTMIRVKDLDASMRFYCDLLGLKEVRRYDSEKGRFSLIFLAAPDDYDMATSKQTPTIELTYNWDGNEKLETGRSWGHLAYRVNDIYAICQKLMDRGVIINRPPRDGYMAFFKSPDNISIELIQENGALPPQEPWSSMENIGNW